MISDDIAEQTAQTVRNIEVLLEAAGATASITVTHCGSPRPSSFHGSRSPM